MKIENIIRIKFKIRIENNHINHYLKILQRSFETKRNKLRKFGSIILF